MKRAGAQWIHVGCPGRAATPKGIARQKRWQQRTPPQKPETPA